MRPVALWVEGIGSIEGARRYSRTGTSNLRQLSTTETIAPIFGPACFSWESRQTDCNILPVGAFPDESLALRRPEVEALLPDDYDRGRGRIRIHRETKTGNDEWLPVVAPLVKLLSDGFEQINLRRAEYKIRKKIKGTNLAWRGWYAFRRGLATNPYRCGMRPEQACLILRNSAEVVRRHYIRLEQERTKVDAMARLEQAYEQCAAGVQ